MGVLLLHGFSGTPFELTALARALPQEVEVSAPVLPGHGSTPGELSKVSYEDWIACARSSYRELRARFPWVGVAGLSMGGALAQLLYEEDPPPDRVVLLATPVKIEDRKGKWVLPLVRLLSLKNRWIYVKERGSDLADREERFRVVNYRWVPLEALAELDALLKFVMRKALRATAPTLLLHSQNDHTAPFRHALLLKERLGEEAYLVALQRSYHVLTRDVEREEVARITSLFLTGTPFKALPLPQDWKPFPPSSPETLSPS